MLRKKYLWLFLGAVACHSLNSDDHRREPVVEMRGNNHRLVHNNRVAQGNLILDLF